MAAVCPAGPASLGRLTGSGDLTGTGGLTGAGGPGRQTVAVLAVLGTITVPAGLFPGLGSPLRSLLASTQRRRADRGGSDPWRPPRGERQFWDRE